MQSQAKQGKARRSKERRGEARRVEARRVEARRGEEGHTGLMLQLPCYTRFLRGNQVDGLPRAVHLSQAKFQKLIKF